MAQLFGKMRENFICQTFSIWKLWMESHLLFFKTGFLTSL